MAETTAKAKPRKQKEADKLKKDIQTLTADLKRTAADYENYRKRVERDSKMLRAHALQTAIDHFLTPLDNFGVALKHTKNHEEFVKGMEMIHKQFEQTLTNLGLQSINPLNQPFDPARHEAVEQVISDKKENTIIEVIQTGYELQGQVIRLAKVKIAKNDTSK